MVRYRRSAAAIAAAVTLAVTIGDSARAQTLADPGSQPPRSWSPPAVKPRASANVKSCSGDGAVNISGTGTCIKIGGTVTVGGTSRGR